LQARSVVSIGAERSGRVAEVLADVDERVDRNAVLARLDAASAEQALAEARASLRAARADVARARSIRNRSRTDDERTRTLGELGLVPREEQERAAGSSAQSQAEFDRALAQQALAALKVEQAELDLTKLVIRSPIEGVVLTRSVEPGSVVAASFASPELFTIAADLRKMELALPINEADIGRVARGQLATFVVDAWPERLFTATLRRIALAPTTHDNVISYRATLDVPNPDGALRPGMTATATVTAQRSENVLRVPIAALRFKPSEQDESASLLPVPFAEGDKRRSSAVWILRDEVPMRVPVSVGATDGEHAEVPAGQLAEGDEVIVGESLVQESKV
jgi:HlyD family secretion protein